MTASLTARYLRTDLATGANDGTSEANAWQSWTQCHTDYTDGLHVHVEDPASRGEIVVGGGSLDFTTTTITTGAVFETYSNGGSPGDKGVARFKVTGSVQSLKFPHNAVVEGFNFDDQGNLCRVNGGICTWIRFFQNTNVGTSMSGWFDRCKLVCTGNGQTLATPGGVSHHGVIYRCWLEHQGVSGTNTIVKQDMFNAGLSVESSVLVGAGSATTRGVYIDRLDASFGGSHVTGNIFYDMADAVVLDEKGDTATLPRGGFLMNRNIFEVLSAYILNETSSTTGDDWSARLLGNWYRAVTSGVNNIPGAWEDENVLLSAAPFVDAANDDFTLNATAGGGAVLRAAGFPINMLYDWDNMQEIAVVEAGGGGGATAHAF